MQLKHTKLELWYSSKLSKGKVVRWIKTLKCPLFRPEMRLLLLWSIALVKFISAC